MKDASTQGIRQIFQAIYANKSWGSGGNDDFWSGPGSHLPEFVNPYIDAVRSFAAGLQHRANAVDLGCGDFNIGSQLRSCFDRYVACDIVPELIERNKQRFADLNVEFLCFDFSTADLPSGDIVFLRYVLQHLSNDRIGLLVSKLHAFKYVILTEAVPRGEFVANADMPTSAAIRLQLNSGVVLTELPFGLKVRSSRLLRQYEWGENAIIKTILYEM